MTDRSNGPACGNNPNHQLDDIARKALADFKARLALQAAAKPYIKTAAWVDGDPLMETIAVTLWQNCARDDAEQPQAVRDDPRTIAAFAAAVVRAYTEGQAPAGQAALRDRIAEALAACQGGTTWGAMAEAVLAVLPPPADQAAVLREAADRYAKLTDQNEAYDREHGQFDAEARLQHGTVRDVVAGLRRMADEAQQPSPRCTCGTTACESEQCDCDSVPCPVDHAAEAQQQCSAREPLDEAQCSKQAGHEGPHSDRPGRIWYPAPVEEEGCGAEPPADGTWGDCWCTLPPGHEGEHRCQPCTHRHGAPGWIDQPAAGAGQDGAQQ